MKLHIQSTGFSPTKELDKYTASKLNHVTRHLSRQQRLTADADVSFTEKKLPGGKMSHCDVVLRIGPTEFRAAEATQHMYAALDIAAVSLEHQIQDHLARQGQRAGDWLVP